MGESHGLGDLIAAREILRSSIEKSTQLAVAVDETSSRLGKAHRNLPHLQAAINDVACKCAVYEIRDHVDRAVGPCASVLKVLDLVYELQDSLETDPRAAGLFTYLTNIKRLQEALKLLADNCRLVALWLEDIMQFLKNIGDDSDWYLVQLSKVTTILQELQGKGESGVFLSSAFDNLEREYKRLLTEKNSLSFHQDSYDVIEEVQGIVEVLAANNRLDRCISIYAEARIANARATLQALNVEYLDIQLSETVSVQTVDGYIDEWDKHMEFAAKHLLQKEHRLCIEVHRKIGSNDDAWMDCFAKIASQCGFMEIFEFGSKICKCKKEAIKLLRLLKIFSTLDRLRLQFNDLFDGKYCVEIQNRTRDILKKVVVGTCEIFWELSVQVELQRAFDPPPDGSVPRLVCFVAEYCNNLLEEENSSFLVRILEIHQVWNNNTNNNRVNLDFEIRNIMKALEINLEIWAKRYDDTALSYLFMMNSHWYLCHNIRGTKLGDLMGDSWLWAYEDSSEHYAALYMRESWEKIVVLLREEGLILIPGGRAVDRNLVKRRVHFFGEAFDDMYKKQSKWILSDKALRWKTCGLIAEAIVPPYRSYLQRFIIMAGLENEIDGVKYSAERLEDLIGTLFEPRVGKYGNSKCTDLNLIGIKNGDLSHLSSSTPAAA